MSKTFSRRVGRALLRSAPARIVQEMRSIVRNAGVVKIPSPALVDRGWPANPNGPRIVTYTEHDPRPALIGPYSSINDNSYLMLGSNHRTDFVTTWPFLDADIPYAEQTSSNGPITIGSDVLTSFESLILSGVTVGHGAVIAARAVVTKDVPPYAIVGGVPAVVIGWRFEQAVREALLRIAWWEWGHEKVLAHARQLASPDVDAFVASHDPEVDGGACPECDAAAPEPRTHARGWPARYAGRSRRQQHRFE